MSFNDPTPASYGADLAPTTTVDQHDLNSSDRTIEVPLDTGVWELVVAAHSDDNASFSASITWKNAEGNVTQEDSKSDLGLSSITEGHAAVQPKGEMAVITFTDASGAGANVINAHVQIKS
jgi:hypothetical protein